ncbi:MAG: hypothetical protein IJK46_07905 [Prevotella sp.]|nr:hypothetical protein [Prevotella sp.]
METKNQNEAPTIVTTSKELGQAIKEEKDTIIVEGDLTKKVVRIKATGKVAWGVAAAALGIGVFAIVHTPHATVATAPAGGVGGAISFTGGAVSTGAAGAILGPAAITALTVAVAAGGIGALKTLREKYKIQSKEDKKLVLKRK